MLTNNGGGEGEKIRHSCFFNQNSYAMNVFVCCTVPCYKCNGKYCSHHIVFRTFVGWFVSLLAKKFFLLVIYSSIFMMYLSELSWSLFYFGETRVTIAIDTFIFNLKIEY